MSPKPFELTRESDISPELLEMCRAVTAKRARTVIDHILKHGMITTEELKNSYNYDHPPRAARDVRENGIPLKTNKIVSGTTGRSIGAYTFEDPSKIKKGRIGGRKAFSKVFKDDLVRAYGSKDAFTGEALDPRYLQIDHRIPYEVSGDSALDNCVEDFMLIDASSQRAKSWSCEHCDNLIDTQDAEICRTCFWAYPEQYEHIATEQKRRIDLTWTGDELDRYNRIAESAQVASLDIRSFIKNLLHKVK